MLTESGGVSYVKIFLLRFSFSFYSTCQKKCSLLSAFKKKFCYFGVIFVTLAFISSRLPMERKGT